MLWRYIAYYYYRGIVVLAHSIHMWIDSKCNNAMKMSMDRKWKFLNGEIIHSKCVYFEWHGKRWCYCVIYVRFIISALILLSLRNGICKWFRHFCALSHCCKAFYDLCAIKHFNWFSIENAFVRLLLLVSFNAMNYYCAVSVNC